MTAKVLPWSLSLYPVSFVPFVPSDLCTDATFSEESSVTSLDTHCSHPSSATRCCIFPKEFSPRHTLCLIAYVLFLPMRRRPWQRYAGLNEKWPPYLIQLAPGGDTVLRVYTWPNFLLTVGVLCKAETVTCRLPAPAHVFLICCHAFPVKNALSWTTS